MLKSMPYFSFTYLTIDFLFYLLGNDMLDRFYFIYQTMTQTLWQDPGAPHRLRLITSLTINLHGVLMLQPKPKPKHVDVG